MKMRYIAGLLLVSSMFLCNSYDVHGDDSNSADNVVKWTDSDYDNYDYATFLKHPSLNTPIDLKNIHYAFLNAAVFYYTNKARVDNGMPVFKHSTALEKAAFGHSKDMVERNFFSHTSVIAEKRSMVQRLAMVGITNAYCGENICDNFDQRPTYGSIAKKMVEGWMNSPGHRQNILGSHYLYLGCGAVYYFDSSFPDYPRFKATQNFSDKKG